MENELRGEIEELCAKHNIASVSLVPGCLSYSRELQSVWQKLRAYDCGELTGNYTLNAETRVMTLYR